MVEINFQNPDEPLHWFETQVELIEHLWQMAFSFMESSTLERMEPADRRNWLFKQAMLIRHFVEADVIE